MPPISVNVSLKEDWVPPEEVSSVETISSPPSGE